jgi:hypothetical protein
MIHESSRVILGFREPCYQTAIRAGLSSYGFFDFSLIISPSTAKVPYP